MTCAVSEQAPPGPVPVRIQSPLPSAPLAGPHLKLVAAADLAELAAAGLLTLDPCSVLPTACAMNRGSASAADSLAPTLLPMRSPHASHALPMAAAPLVW